jgi:hypothetical protein
MRIIRSVLIAATLPLFLLCSFVAPAWAHHSFASMFDISRVGKLRGVVTKVGWVTPHPYITLDVTDERGATASWYIEGSNVRNLERMGWTAATVRPGSTITACGYLNRLNISSPPPVLPNGAVPERAMIGVIVTLSDGRELQFLNPNQTSCPL